MAWRRHLQTALLTMLIPVHAAGQRVVVDEGTFTIYHDGQEVGTEEFTIRREGLGPDATVFAHAVVSVNGPEGRTEMRPLLQTTLPDGAASNYQLSVSGAQSAEVSLALVGRRFVSLIRTQRGEEEREFLAGPDTRILEQDIAHQYYFLRNQREGSITPVIEPRSRRRLRLNASQWSDEELRIGVNRIQARRVTFSVDDEDRHVWYDRQGRVVRVEVPARAYVAERADLVG
ncbi:MAG: hypothetical protein P8170_16210 [Gemmatimonadota bacterium]|jgi:hypothetical protein